MNNVLERYNSVRYIVAVLLRDNPILRCLKYRKLLRKIVERELNYEISDETVPRACRELQSDPPSGLGKYKADEEGIRRELEKAYHDYFST